MWYKLIAIMAVIIIISVGAVFFSRKSLPAGSTEIKVVAAENFWGSLVSQIGGEKIQVSVILSDPNADPHEYESGSQTASVFAGAKYIIINGAGYDSWADKLLSSSNNSNIKILKVSDLLNKKIGENPHFWYNPQYVNEITSKMLDDLISLDPSDAETFRQNYQSLNLRLQNYQELISLIKMDYGGEKVAATEDIFSYLASAAGLDLISPKDFMQAMSEGNDPPVQSVIFFQNQIRKHIPKILVYNSQTVTPITESLKKLAVSENIKVVGITELIQPKRQNFQDWMYAEVKSIWDALAVQN